MVVGGCDFKIWESIIYCLNLYIVLIYYLMVDGWILKFGNQ